MAYASQSRTNTFALGNRISALIASFMEAREQRKVYLSTLRELDALTDKELADIGLNRSMLKSIALEAAQKK